MLSRCPATQMLDRLTSPSLEWYPSIQFTYWLQYHLHRQLLQASQYAASRHVALKGDLPIGACSANARRSRQSAAMLRAVRPARNLFCCNMCRCGQVQRGHLAVPQALSHGCQHRYAAVAWLITKHSCSLLLFSGFATASSLRAATSGCLHRAGAPPDYFDPNGQNWGFPTYNWEEMAKDGYRWWRRRLAHIAEYFHAYRIDHILGFFRIWEIPGDCSSGILGHFRPSIPLSRHVSARWACCARCVNR